MYADTARGGGGGGELMGLNKISSFEELIIIGPTSIFLFTLFIQLYIM